MSERNKTMWKVILLKTGVVRYFHEAEEARIFAFENEAGCPTIRAPLFGGEL